MHATQHLTRRHIDHAEAIYCPAPRQAVAALHIDAEVIDAAAHLPKRYLRLEYERWASRLRHCRGGPDQARGQKDRPAQHVQLFTMLICVSAAFSPSASFFASSLA